MTDWRRLTQARGINLPEPELIRLAAVLEKLETVLKPLVHELPPGTEPAIVFRAAHGEEA
jgi:hypothetical protein